MSRFTNEQKLRAVKKEISFRWEVYRKRVGAGKMTQAQMNDGIAIMKEIKSDYEEKIRRERLGGLFNG